VSGWRRIDSVPLGETLLFFRSGAVFEGQVYETTYGDETVRNFAIDWQPEHGCGCCSDPGGMPSHWRPKLAPPA
jgi:hypothetical protein